MVIRYKEFESVIVFGKYQNNNTAIELYGAKGSEHYGELITTVTINGNIKLDNPDIVGIKTWSENTGILDVLIKEEIIKPNLLFVEPTGFVQIMYFELTDKAKIERDKQFKEYEIQ